MSKEISPEAGGPPSDATERALEAAPGSGFPILVAEPPVVPPATVWFRVLLALILVGMVSYAGGLWLWRQLKIRRGQQQAALAEMCLREKRYPEAQRAIRTAILMAPNDPQVLRTTARWCTFAGRPEGLAYWERLFALTTPSVADRLEELDFALALNRLDVSRNLLTALLSAEPKNREVTLRVLRHNGLSGDVEAAIAAARTAVALFPLDEQFQINLGSLLLSRPDRAQQLEGRHLLWAVALSSGRWREMAADHLVASEALDRGDRELLIHDLEKREPIGFSDQLKVFDLRLSLVGVGPERALIWQRAAALADRFSTVTDRLLLARWLAQRGETNRGLEILPRAAVPTNEVAAIATLEILLRWGTAGDVRKLLDQRPSALPEALQESARGVLAVRVGRPAEASGHFASALQQAWVRPGLLLQVAGLAELAGQPLAAVEGLTRAAELNPSLTLQCCRRALALVRPMDDLTIARETVVRLAEFLPGEDSVAAERAWLDLLFNERIEASSEVLSRLLPHPQLGELARFALALADLRKGRPALAMSRLEVPPVVPERLSPRLQAVYAAVLLANDQREPARRVAHLIPTHTLRVQERDLIDRLL